MDRPPLVYLACPYTHDDAAEREARFEAANQAAAAMMSAGGFVFSPITHGHPLAAFGLPTDWKYWQAYDRRILEQCDELAILDIPGWPESEGVAAEVAIATGLGLPVYFVDRNGRKNFSLEPIEPNPCEPAA